MSKSADFGDRPVRTLSVILAGLEPEDLDWELAREAATWPPPSLATGPRRPTLAKVANVELIPERADLGRSREFLPLIGCVNDRQIGPFAPGTVLLTEVRASRTRGYITVRIRDVPWNTLPDGQGGWADPDAPWVEPLYKSAEFP